MGSGGARRGSGPAPDPLSFRSERRLRQGKMPEFGLMVLPRERKGTAPAWPLSKSTPRELVIWRRVWKLPQAKLWEENRADDEVAFYVRTFVECEERGVAAARRSLLMAQRRSLLLTDETLERAGYRVAVPAADLAALKSSPATSPPGSRPGFSVPSSRDRLRAVPALGESGDD